MASSTPTSIDRRIALRSALAVGYVALAVGVLLAETNPPGAYELSMYAATPTGFWAGLGVAMAISLLVSVAARPGWTRTVALVLGGSAIAVLAGLPVVRGYFFYGTADALTHLGWTRDIATEAMAPSELFYPGIHSVANLVASVGGLGLEQALVLTVAAISLVGIVFIPLVVRTVASGRLAVVVAAFATFMLFFVHNLGVYLHAHAFSQATFFSALVLFLAVAYLVRGPGRALGVCLALVSVSVLFFHPQQAANLVVIFLGISLVQVFYRRYREDSPMANHRALYGHAGFLFVAFWVWTLRFEGWAVSNIERVGDALSAYLAGSPPTAGGAVRSNLGSLEAIGSGLPEIFLKLFLVAAVFSLLAGALMLAGLLGRVDRSRPTANALVVYLAVGSIALLPLVAAYFAGNVAKHYFRHLGFMLLIVTIVGSLALARGMDRLSGRFSPRLAAVALVLVLALLLPVSLATAYPSPWIHKQSQHVTEQHLDGYETVLEVNDESLELAGIREGPKRYSDAIEGVSAARHYSAVVTNENLTRLSTALADGGYLVTTDYAYRREVDAYRELRYTDRALRSVAAQPGVNRVVANEAVQLYHVPEDGE